MENIPTYMHLIEESQRNWNVTHSLLNHYISKDSTPALSHFWYTSYFCYWSIAGHNDIAHNPCCWRDPEIMIWRKTKKFLLQYCTVSLQRGFFLRFLLHHLHVPKTFVKISYKPYKTAHCYWDAMWSFLWDWINFLQLVQLISVNLHSGRNKSIQKMHSKPHHCSVGMVDFPLTDDKNGVGKFKFTLFTFYCEPSEDVLANIIKKPLSTISFVPYKFFIIYIQIFMNLCFLGSYLKMPSLNQV